MTSTERKRLFITAAIGAAMTAIVSVADHFDWLAPLEHWLYDRRAHDCQYFTPPATDKLVHIDIDDSTLASIGRWPWPRTVLAGMIDELKTGGAKVIGLDIILPEAEPGGDPILAQSISRAGNVLAPFAFEPRTKPTLIGRDMVATLGKNLELDRKTLFVEMAKLGYANDEAFIKNDDNFVRARADAMFDRILQVNSQLDHSAEDLRRLLLPHTDPSLTGAPLLRLLKNQYERTNSIIWLRRSFARPLPPELPLMMPMEITHAPVPLIANAAGTTGYVYYLADTDSKVRSMPLWAEHRGWMFTQLGVALACKQLDVPLSSIRIEADRMTIPIPGRDIVVPFRKEYVPTLDSDVGLFYDIPWFGTSDFITMYDDRKSGALRKTHIPANNVWDIRLLQDRIERNTASIDVAVKFILNQTDPDKAAEFEQVKFASGDIEGRVAWIDEAFKRLKETPYGESNYYDFLNKADLLASEKARAEAERKYHEAVDAAKKKNPNVNLTKDEAIEKLRTEYRFATDDLEYLNSFKVMRENPKESRELKVNVAEMRAALKREIEGRTVLVGWTATGSIADFVPTPLHSRCPGVVVHGVIFNSILTDEFWWPTAGWVTLVILIGLGILTTLAVSFLSPFAAAACAAVLGFAYLIVNGILLFDYGNVLVGIAGPLTAVALVWGATTIFRYVDEIRERRHITRRFRNYVDPALVQYVIEHPEEIQLDGQKREMTVVFTDLAGFTTISERLQEKTVDILNQYFSLMVPVITSNTGLVNKFLGDGIMFFYGAPIVNNDHAIHAVTTTIQMHDVLPAFNLELEAKGLPPVKMRAGISTGSMIVGDAGGADRSDYTVLGDTVNLGARLESANKYTGTQTLITQNTLDLCRDLFLVRPVAKLVVKGKTEGVMTYEPLAFKRDATEEQVQLAAASKAVVDAYIAGEFEACLAAIAKMEEVTGPVKFTQVYADLCHEYIAKRPTEFSGMVVLDEK